MTPDLTMCNENTGNHTEELVKSHLPIVFRLATQMSRTTPASITRDDLVSAGMFGLAEAANRYDRNRAEGFRGYAEARIRGAIIDEIRTHTPLPRDLFEKSTQVRKCIRDLNHALGRLPYDDEVAAKLEIPLEKYHKLKSSFSQVTVLSPALVDMAVSNAQGYFNEHPDNPQDQYFLAELQEQLANFIKKLSPREQRVLSMYYRDELLLKEIGEKMGVTESRISQILSETVQRLREMIEASDG